MLDPRVGATAAPSPGRGGGSHGFPVWLTYVGHATVVIEMSGIRLITDPVLRPRVAHLRRTAPMPRVAAPVDCVLVSHAHMDHLDPRSIALLGGDPVVVVPRGAARFVRGRRGVVEVGEGDQVEIGPVTVHATHAEHDGRRYALGRSMDSLGYRIRGDRSVYFAGDTGLFAGMADIGRSGIDVALLPVAGWGPRLPPGHLDPQAAACALELIAPGAAVPIHWGTLAPILARRRGPGPSESPAEEFARHAAAVAPDVKVIVLAPGEAVHL
jgi:L-ascorbate metabolism protein UlaG (beta-lactamase superfamily)